MRLTRLSARIGATLLAAGALVLTGAIAASAATPVQLSSNGISYGATLAQPVFATIPTLVPGDSAHAGFWVRNASGDKAVLAIVVRSAVAAPLALSSTLSIQAASNGVTGDAVTFGDAVDCAVLVTGVTLQPGEAVPVDLTLALSDLAGDVGQNGTASLEVGVSLRQKISGAMLPGCAADTVSVTVVGAPTPTPTPTDSATPTPSPTASASHAPAPASGGSGGDAGTAAAAGSGIGLIPTLALGGGGLLLFLLLVALLWWWIIGRRRRRDEENDGRGGSYGWTA